MLDRPGQHRPHARRRTCLFAVSKQAGRGFTLVEALLASVVLAASITAVTLPFTSSARNRQVDGRQSAAVGLAEELMEEILAQNFQDEDAAYACNPGPDPGENTRAQFDNVDDYDGYCERPGGVADIEGAPANAKEAYGLSRSVAANYVYVAGQDTGKPASFIRVTVEVSYGEQTVVSLTRLVYDTPKG